VVFAAIQQLMEADERKKKKQICFRPPESENNFFFDQSENVLLKGIIFLDFVFLDVYLYRNIPLYGSLYL